MYQDYVKMYLDKRHSISHGSLVKLEKLLTSSIQNSLKDIDYACVMLLHSSLTLMRELVGKMMDHFPCKVTHEMLTNLEHFLKYD